MKKILLYTILCLAAASLLAGCSKEEPFVPGETPSGEAKFLKSQLNVDVKTEDKLVRAAATPDVNDFNVSFFVKGEETPRVTYRYRDMPEVVTLKVFGDKTDYVVRASYGENAPAAWDAPYYEGEGGFTVTPNSVAADVEPVVCRLANIRVSIRFDADLTGVMTSDSKVTVNVGDQGSLDFTKQDEGRSGYFAYVASSNSTLTATFYGTVSGVETIESKTHSDLVPGSHYYITFSLRNPDEEDPGYVNGMLTVDATVQRIDSNGNVTPEEDLLEDDSRPNQGEGPKPPTPPSTGDGPEITACAGVSLDSQNLVSALVGKPVELYIKSEKGIEEFNVQISSTNTGFESAVAEMLGLDLDLCNPGSAAENLVGLGLIQNEAGVKGLKDVTFSLTDFMELLENFEGTHTFTLVVADADGSTTKQLVIKV